MAISEHTQPASAGKADGAERLISDMLSALETATQDLRQLQHWPEKLRIADEADVLRSVAKNVWDAEDGIKMFLEVMAEEQ